MPERDTVQTARVAALKPFGVFVRFEGFKKDGLVHVSQLVNGRRVEHPEEVVQEGDEVKVLVLSTDNGRLSCSMRQVDQATGEVVASDRPTGGGGGGGGRGGGRDNEPLPELYSIHRVEVVKLEAFGAFCRLGTGRKQGLLHISQVSNSRVEADDLKEILEVGQECFVKVIAVDQDNGKVSLSMKLVSQGNGRDLDPTHVEATAEGERRGGGGGGKGGGGGRDARQEREGAMASMQVNEYGGKRSGGGDERYAMVSDGEDDDRGGGGGGGGTYNLKMPGGGSAPPPPSGVEEEARRKQVEMAAQLLAKAEAKKATKEKKEKKREKKESKKKHKHKSDKHKSSHKKEKRSDKKRKRSRS